MAAYLELVLELAGRHEFETDLVAALLSEFGFEGFLEEEGRVRAYIRSGFCNPESLASFLQSARMRPLIRAFKESLIPERNWNALWEKGYAPVEISGTCMIRAPFHPPGEGLAYDLVISPKMSFGTGHHETTRLMIETMLEIKWTGLRVIDIGSGTGILAILAEKMGASEVLALDNDPLACRNALENLELNRCRKTRVVLGDAGAMNEEPCDALLGNLSLNVLLAGMGKLGTLVRAGGTLLFSGFFKEDLQILNESAGLHGLVPLGKRTLNRWTVAVYRKAD